MIFRRLFLALLFVSATWLGYKVTLSAIPKIAMKTVDARFEERGLPENTFGTPMKITTDNQTVVRSSPDLAYSICRIDLTNGPIEVRGGVWEGYGSLTVLDGNTNSVFVTSLNENDEAPRGVVLERAGLATPPSYQTDLPQRSINSDKAIALIRRLAPDEDSYKRAKLAAEKDFCASFSAQ